MSDFNGIFFLSLATLICGSFGLLIKTCYKIKCTDVDCLCFHFKRDVEEELQIDLEEGKNGNRRSSSLTMGLGSGFK
jgi:hypothetical protein